MQLYLVFFVLKSVALTDKSISATV